MSLEVKLIDDVLRIPNFRFTNELILGVKHKHAALALGAVIKDPTGPLRLGVKSFVTKKLIVVFESAVEVRTRLPTMQLNLTPRFWEAVLDQIREHDRTISAHLTVDSLMHIVTVYRKAFQRGRADLLAKPAAAMIIQQKLEDGDEEGDTVREEDRSDMENASATEDPRERLLNAVEEWYEGGHMHIYEGSPSMPNPHTIQPTRYFGETVEAFLQRLQQFNVNRIEELQNALKKQKDRCYSIVTAQRLSDKKNLEQHEAARQSLIQMSKEKDKLKKDNSKLKRRINDKLVSETLALKIENLKLKRQMSKLEAKVPGFEELLNEESELDED